MTDEPTSPPADESDGWLRSKHAMWLGTTLPVVHLGLAVANVGKAYELWINGWWATVAVATVILGVKPGKDVLMAAVQRGQPK